MPKSPKMEQGVLIALSPRESTKAPKPTHGDSLPEPPERKVLAPKPESGHTAQQYKALMDGNPIPVVTWKREGGDFVFVDFNAAAAEFFGAAAGERLGISSRELYPDQSEITLDIERAYTEKKRVTREMRYTTRTQPARRLHMRFSFAPCPPDTVLMFCEDMSQGMQFWEDRKKAEQRFRALFAAAPVGIYQTGPGGRFEHVNMRLARMYGFDSPDDMELGVKDASELFADVAQRDKFQRVLAENGAVDDFECLVWHKSGSTFWVSKSVKQIRDASGHVVSSMGFELEITERKMAEALREEVERITRHDLKSPLNAIVGLSNFMQEEDNLTDDQVESLAMIEHSGNTMLNMINLSLAVYRMERGTYDLKSKIVDLVGVLNDVLMELKPHLEALKVQVNVRVRGTLPGPGVRFEVFGDQLLCWAMLYHLVQNAADGSQAGDVVQVDLTENGGCGIIIHNTGVIAPEVRETIFEKFVTHGKKEGTGLGAYCVRLIARTLGGEISFTSNREDGTTMNIRLPRPAR